jgi:NAD dependent epimerase/dehydratase family enzyme
MRILITGATGTIGLSLADALHARGDQVVALSRDPERGQRVLGPDAELHAWPDPTGSAPPTGALTNVDAVVNLLGEPVAQRWTSETRVRIRAPGWIPAQGSGLTVGHRLLRPARRYAT